MLGVTTWVRRHLLGVLTLSLVVVTVLLFGVLGLGALVAVASSGASVSALLGAVLPWAAAAVLLTALAVGLFVGLLWTLVSRLSVPRLPRSQRAADLLARVERHSGVARSVNASGFVAPPEPTPDERIGDLRRRYVDDDLTEDELERHLDAVLDDPTVAGAGGSGGSGSHGGHSSYRSGRRSRDRGRMHRRR
ncbi:hypothetical protein [Halomarina ordinaria]|uniref:SHOCT domain-containing protein n=1 Tax=Halomarina ordinaria TaxID=3033939 RepID=A0ABD5UCL0_9EURY|nr:hypothetical protein [Halomarina sp. PSRA2]